MSRRMWDDVAHGDGRRGLLGLYYDAVFRRKEEPLTVPASGVPSQVDQGTRYTYTALPTNSEPVSIRLLELQPRNSEDGRMVCRLTHQRLAECHGRYEALSYVWGNTADLIPLSVNGKYLPIGRNLYQALTDLQYSEDSRVLWVDAVCIDQTVVDERNQQVAAMAEIYRRAARRVIYLGPGYKTATPSAFAIVERFATEASSVQTGLDDMITLSSLSQGPFVASKVSRKEIYAMRTIDLRHLAQSPWLERAWTAQELLLASKALVVTGSHSMDWEQFYTGINFGLRTGILDTALAGMLVDPVILPYLSTHGLQQKWYMFSVITEDIAMALAERLLALLVHSRTRHSTDPRDKIYAYLGLTSVDHSVPSFLGIKPDYAADVSDVYQNAAQNIMLHSGSLDVLGACLPSASPELPTWIPDWNNTGQAPRPLMYDTFGNLRSSQVSFANPRAPAFTHDGQKLVLSGHHIASVQSLSRVLPRPIQGAENLRRVIPKGLGYSWPAFIARALLFLPFLLAACWEIYKSLLKVVTQLSILAELEEFARETTPSNPAEPQHTVKDDPFYVYWRTISAGAGGAKGLSEASQLFHTWRAEHRTIFRMCALRIHKVLPSLILITYIQTTWSQFNGFMRYLEMAYERRLGRCSNRYLTLLPAAAQVGDKIVLVKQGRVPLVLRREKEGTGYSFVGEAYVEGIMDGEAFRQEECMELVIH